MGEFAKNLQRLRINKGLSQTELSKLIGTNRSTVGNYEQGIREPSFEMLIKIARALGCTTDELIRGHE